MRKTMAVLTVSGLAIAAAGHAWADDEAAARAILGKAIQAQGGEELLAKYKGFTGKMKGTVHAQGMELEFTGEMATLEADRYRVSVDLEVGGQKFNVAVVLNRDKGWMKFNEETIDMDADKLAETRHEAYAGWLTTLVPLKDKAFKLATVGEVKVHDRPAVGIRISKKDQRDVSFYFDKETHLLVKTETRVKDDETGEEVLEESFLSGHIDKPLRPALKFVTKRDGKPYLEGEFTEFKPEEKLDDIIFAKP